MELGRGRQISQRWSTSQMVATVRGWSRPDKFRSPRCEQQGPSNPGYHLLPHRMDISRKLQLRVDQNLTLSTPT